MSTTLSTSALVSLVQQKTAIGLPATYCLDRLNEGFRFINQLSKGGFIWQLKSTNLSIPILSTQQQLPLDFDPGKTAILRGDGTSTFTIIPYLPWKDFVNQSHFQTTQPGFWSAWTFTPSFVAPATYAWQITLGPSAAANPSPMTLPFMYHAVNFQPVPLSNSAYFPTPDQFDSLIADLAIAEIQDTYKLTDGQRTRDRALRSINELIDTYRTDRYDLAGLSDQVAQAQEKQAETAR